MQLLPSADRASVTHLIQARGLVDVVIPRGGAGLIDAVVRDAMVPTIETGVGNCHVYVHESADLDVAERILLNAKTRRPSVCNAAESLLIDAAIAEQAVPRLTKALQDAGVTVHDDPSEEELRAEFLSMDIALAVVDGLDAAIAHVNEYGTGHTEAIVTTNLAAAQRFTERVDAAAVMVNASTAFTDGEQFGFGAEIGISTQKLHARGPMGLPELTSTKWIVWGDGHTRPADHEPRRKPSERPRTPGTAVRRHRRCRASGLPRPATCPTPPPPQRCSSPTGWASRCWSKAPRASARPNWRVPSRRPPAPAWCGCSATRASTRPAPSTSGTTPSRSCASRPGHGDWDETKTDVFSEEFLLTRPLLTAIRRTEPTVLLIDETDKADIEIEGLLLEVLSDFAVTVPELGTITAERTPFVVLTSNATRELSEALKRRCLFLHIDFPDPELERRILLSRVPELPEHLAEELVRIIGVLRGMQLKKLPSVAETIDWGRTLLALGLDTIDDATDRRDARRGAQAPVRSGQGRPGS